jgi:hypothetical protein
MGKNYPESGPPELAAFKEAVISDQGMQFHCLSQNL